MIKLIIADDHSYLVEGVKQSLLHTDVDVIAHATDVNDINKMYADLKPDVLLCDIMFGQIMHGLDAVRELMICDPAAKVIIFSQYEQIEIIEQAYEVGAKAFLPKSVSAADLVSVIHKVHSGELYFDKDVAVKLAVFNHQVKVKNPKIEEILDKKEIEVFKYLADGLTEKEIAEKVGIATRTVSNIKIALKEKLKVHKPSEFTKLAIKHKLISVDMD